MIYKDIIDKYYPQNDELKQLLLKHSSDVAEKAIDIVRRHPELGADAQFVHEAAMLHDIGICRTDAPSIHCHGTDPYILHGINGGRMLRNEGLPELARVCERHTGTGITRQQIIDRNLPLPPGDYCPETIEEQIVCYADKFFSKTKLGQEKTMEKALRSIAKFGDDGAARFVKWSEIFD